MVKPAGDDANAAAQLDLLIGGVHCAACIQKVESSLLQRDSVSKARLNFSSGRLHIEWDGSAALADDFVQGIEDLGYRVSPYDPDREARAQSDEGRFLLMCLGVAGFAAGNIMLLSVGLWITNTQSMGFATRELLHWLSAMIALPAVFYAGRPFFRSAFAVLRKGQANMDVPIAVALILACAMSLFQTLNGAEHVYFDSAVMLMFFLLVGRVLDFLARRSAQGVARDLLQSLSGFATVLDENGQRQRLLVRDLKPGMRVLVAAGEKIPADGFVLEGRSAIDTALVTGESLPQSVEKGAQLYAGTVNIEAALTIEVAHESDKSLLAEIVRLMENAQQSHAQYVRLADRAARLYTPFVHSLAVLAFVAWFGLWGASWQDALMIAVTVLIITCPCALGLAVPIVQVLASGLLMKRGLLLKSGDALERLARVDTLVFDKTGTLTIGKPMLQAGDYAAADLRLAASLALHSAHPLSKALVEAYKGDDLLPLDAVREVAGQGLEGFYDGQRVRIGQRSWCGYTGDAPDHYGAELCLAFGDHTPILFTFEDELRSDAVETVQALRQRGMQVILLSGDRMEAAAHIAGLLGIEDYYAAQKPDDKYAFVQALRAKGAHVLMVGDGLNDAAALAAADVSVAPGSAIDMTQKTADVVFMGDKLEPLLFLHKVARRSLGLVKTNFALAILYNIFAVPLAFAGHVTPMFAALAMSASSLLVIANSFRLKLIR